MADIDLLSLQPHKVSRDLSGYITYIYGTPKVGKTSLAAEADDCLLLACERGYNAIPGIIAQDVTSWGDFKKIYKQLKQPEVKAKFKVLIVDTVDIAAKHCTKYICSQQNITELADLPYGRGYQLMRNEFEDMFVSLTQMGYAIIFIGHAQDAIFTRPDGSEYTKIIPSLSPAKVAAIVENMADIYGYAHLVNTPEGTKRVLTLRSPDDSVAAGCRFRYIAPEIPLGYKSLVNALQEAIDQEQENGNEEFITEQPFDLSAIDEKPDFDELMNKFQTLVQQIMDASGGEFGTVWAPRITEITEAHLGKGKKASDLTPAQVDQLDLIVEDLVEAVGNGI